MITYLFMALVMLAIGLLVHVFKMDMLIAGYNTMPKEKKEKVDTKAIGKLLGFYGYTSSFFFLVMAILELLGFEVDPTPVTAIFLVGTFLVLAFAQRYDGNTKWGKDHYEQSKKK
ncbi:DUF3784 domain-containing protein [Alkalibacterium sp.]|nr:MAG: DUF3784 domain-containing protein [Alkalibacterium sp.]